MYTVTVPVTGQGETAQQAAFREAMRDILVRATGRRDAADLESLAPLVAQASRYVVSFRRAAGNQLAVSFDGAAIENAIDAAGLPFWGTDRPVTLVWLALDRGGRRSLRGRRARRARRDSASSGPPRAAACRSCGRVPATTSARGLQQAWSGNHEPLVDAARRYGADGVLIGRARADGRRRADRSTGHFRLPGFPRRRAGELEAGPELAADRYASAYASRNAGQRIEQIVTVTGIDTLEAYALALRTLARLPPVRGVAVDEVTPDAVSFALTCAAIPDALRQAIRREGRLVPVDDGADDLRAVAMNLATIPNLICLLRIALAVPIVWLLAEGRYEATLVLFAIAAVSDALDGYLAKTFGWATELGKVLDPVADKLLLVSVFITLDLARAGADVARRDRGRARRRSSASAPGCTSGCSARGGPSDNP